MLHHTRKLCRNAYWIAKTTFWLSQSLHPNWKMYLIALNDNLTFPLTLPPDLGLSLPLTSRMCIHSILSMTVSRSHWSGSSMIGGDGANTSIVIHWTVSIHVTSTEVWLTVSYLRWSGTRRISRDRDGQRDRATSRKYCYSQNNKHSCH